MLGLNLNESRISGSMITTAETLAGFEILSTIGIVEGVSEGSFPAISVAGIGISKGGDLDRLLDAAREQLIMVASTIGADPIVGFRYQVMGRDLERSAIAYGTAVKCRKIEQ